MIAGYAYNDHHLVSDNIIGRKGYRYVNAPYHIANFWVTYTISRSFLSGLVIGAGGRYTGDQVGNIATQNFLIPSSFIVDGTINYRINRYGVKFNLYNITNQRYFQGGYSRTTTASLGNPINFRASVNYLIN
jgi:iron complex outermembrane receptor protein